MDGGVFGEGVVGFHGVLVQRLTHGTGAGFQAVKLFRVQPGDVDRVGLDEAQVKRIRCSLAMRLGQAGVALSVQADVEDGRRAAPIGVGRAGADGDQRAVAKMAKDSSGIHAMPRRDGADGAGGKGHGFRHRQVKPHQALQAFRPPAMRGCRNGRRGADLREVRGWIVFLHCSTLCSRGAYAENTVNQA